MLKVTLKNLQQQTFVIEIDPEETVKALKEKIETTKGSDYPADGQKLIYSGKILADETQLKEYSIDESKFIVVMVSKPKGATVTSPPPVEATPPSTPATTTAPAATDEQTVSSASSTSGPDEGLVMAGSDFQRTVEQIMAMGYDKAEVEKALRASFNNPDRAVEYLLNGIPDELSNEQAVPNAPAASGGGGGVAEQSAEGGGGSGPLGFLRSQPQFEQMRSVVRENPQLLNAVLQQIGQTNPALLQVISENQEEFVRLLNEDSPPTSSGSSTGSGPRVGLDPGAGGGFQIQITPQDKEAIDRLKSMGFPEHLVVQAYFACEKNETLAANFLLSSNDDD